MLALGCDHGGYPLMKEVIDYLEKNGIEYKNFGTYSDASVDYPEYGKAVANAVAAGECEQGILICGTGIGISITANKVKGIRCALCGDVFSAKATREHNDANILAMGARGSRCCRASRTSRSFQGRSPADRDPRSAGKEVNTYHRGKICPGESFL